MCRRAFGDEQFLGFLVALTINYNIATEAIIPSTVRCDLVSNSAPENKCLDSIRLTSTVFASCVVGGRGGPSGRHCYCIEEVLPVPPLLHRIVTSPRSASVLLPWPSKTLPGLVVKGDVDCFAFS